MKVATVSDLSRCKHNFVPGGSWSIALMSFATGASLKRCGFIGSAVAANAMGDGQPMPVSCSLFFHVQVSHESGRFLQT
jgi:hypothetical protein